MQKQNQKIALGAVPIEGGVHFSLYSRDAQGVQLILFDDADQVIRTVGLDRGADDVWRGFVEGAGAGQRYGYKISGEYDPARGLRFNSHKLLLDPYAKTIIDGGVNKDGIFLSYDRTSDRKDLSLDTRDSSACAPKSVVVDDAFEWQDDRPPAVTMEDLIIYEVHLKGFTAHPRSRVEHPGTYLGFIGKIPYLKELGVNAVELLPVQHFYKRYGLIAKGLNEYWGYNTIGFFAPEFSYGTGRRPESAVHEFKTLVRELHKAGIEVILDVVYNHTGELNETGPTLCFRGIDNRTYYSLKGPDKEPYRFYGNDSGCGNILNLENPVVRDMVLDSLRYWVRDMHVDGFRFDLAPILALVQGRYDREAVFFQAVREDPILSRVKMIAEPWDMMTYQAGQFPREWSEWNDKFRDTVRRFNRGDPGQLADLASRLSGSADLYAEGGRTSSHSINLITCHDGFTLHDLYAFGRKHNRMNGEKNLDGMNENYSWNCGVEGASRDPQIVALRRRMARNAACVLLFSRGTPMLLGGDEILRTQKGNNNAYCQDNKISWFNWDLVPKNADFLWFVQQAIALRKRFSVLRNHQFLSGKDLDADNVPDVLWFDDRLQPVDWRNPERRTLCYQLDGSESPSSYGNYHLFLILNGDKEDKPVMIPQYDGLQWYRVVDTAQPDRNSFMAEGEEILLQPQQQYPAGARSVVVLWGRSKEV